MIGRRRVWCGREPGAGKGRERVPCVTATPRATPAASRACWLPVWQRGGPGIIICSAGLGGKSFWTLERGEKSIGPAARTLLPPAPLQKGTRRLSSWHVDGNAFQKVSTSSLFFSRGIKFNGGVCLNENEFMIPLAKCPLGTRHRKTSKVGMKIWSAEFFLELE